MLFGTKVEIFSQDPAQTPRKPATNPEEDQQQQRGGDSSQSEEENKKVYTALLQNQVLGIDNPYLLREIHQSDEMVVKDKLYSYQMMQ